MFAKKNKQQGVTLLIGMVMLVVLTLLVVFSLRSGNTNLRIAGNMQSQAEAAAATQQVIEKVVGNLSLDATDISTVEAQTFTVANGNANYTVQVESMVDKCLFTAPVLNSQLDTTKANDLICFASTDNDGAVTSDGKLATRPSSCSTQQWEIAAEATDSVSGAKVAQVQGVTVRVPSTVPCR